MIRQLVFAAFATLAIGAVQADEGGDFAKSAIAATHLAPMEFTTAGTTPSDLLLDTAFDADGIMPLWPASDATWSKINDGVRVFPWAKLVHNPGSPFSVRVHGGYYIVGKQKSVAGDSYRAWIARFSLDGSHDTSFGTNGWVFGRKSVDIVDAVVVGSKLYTLVNTRFSVVVTTQVLCMDLSTPSGDLCSGYDELLMEWNGVSPSGPRTNAYGQRLAYDSRFGLYVAARIINTDRGQEVGIARIDADTGQLVTGFRDDGYNIGLPSWADEPNAEVSINDLLITPASYPGGTRLYVAGQMRRSATDHDGFILGLGPSNGATQTGWNWNDHAIYNETDNSPSKKDAVTALAIQRNGKIVFAGWSETDEANTRPMIMGRYNSNGSTDSDFCTSSSCLIDPPASGGTVPFSWAYKPFSLPVAIAERRQNRDLVVVQRFQDNGNSAIFIPGPPYNRVRTLVQQFSASGNVKHATRSIDVSDGTGNANWSRPFAMWMGGTGVWISSENSGRGEEVLAIVGTRKYGTDNYDASLSHLKSNDSIFADQFGGSKSD